MNQRKTMLGICLTLLCIAWIYPKFPATLGKEAAVTKSTPISPAAVAMASSGRGAPGASPASGRTWPILYIQMVRYKPEVPEAKIDALLKSLQQTLRQIPQIKSLSVGRVVDKDHQYDYAVVMGFESMEDLHTYGKSEIHQRWVRENNPVPLGAGHMTVTIQMGIGN